jgi:diguanylate cyclase (GGDEF)-like protein
MLLLVYGLGMLLALLAALSLGQSIIEPIRKLEQAVIRFGEGDTSSRIKLKSNDELGSLAQAFNLVAERYEQIKSELDHLSTQDSLTGLCDPSKLHTEINMEIERAKRYDRAFSVLLIDINNFTEVNKTYGRLVGDSVLCSVANSIRNTIRPTDIAARYGGDEFAIILSETDAIGSYETTQRIFEAIENEPLNIGDGKTLAISISIGYATYPTNADSDSALFALTKKTLTRSKFNKKIKMQLL